MIRLPLNEGSPSRAIQGRIQLSMFGLIGSSLEQILVILGDALILVKLGASAGGFRFNRCEPLTGRRKGQDMLDVFSLSRATH